MQDLYIIIATLLGIPLIGWFVYRIFIWPRQIEKRLRELEDHVLF